MTKALSEIFNSVADFLETNPDSWTTKELAVDANGFECSYMSKYAVRWCAVGRVLKECMESTSPTIVDISMRSWDILNNVADEMFGELMGWVNDELGRESAIEVLREAAKREATKAE